MRVFIFGNRHLTKCILSSRGVEEGNLIKDMMISVAKLRKEKKVKIYIIKNRGQNVLNR